MDLSNIMSEMLKDKIIDKISEKSGTDINSSKKMVAKALPLILGALKDNSNDPEKKESLEKAVKKNDGSVIDNLGLLDLEDGNKILGHIFGDKKENVEKEVGDKKILSALASLVMGALGKANSSSGDSASSLLSSPGLMNIATSFLDKDGDGDIKDDLLGMAMGFFKKK
ncbi:hypothetical protein CSB07_00465 [Candidatus Gracilibacteria bacterium]|nr:MAG: hypothetical protein CSB07_00465 [Candidatus Gracilibacteria bacterium]PIE85104.1 MAG: hypothetical protein CSA08_03600 [Candidatus Gracilibacteria bacterium]